LLARDLTREGVKIGNVVRYRPPRFYGVAEVVSGLMLGVVDGAVPRVEDPPVLPVFVQKDAIRLRRNDENNLAGG
jgi:hypothetical protein